MLKYIGAILAKNAMANCSLVRIPRSVGHYLTKDSGDIIANIS